MFWGYIPPGFELEPWIKYTGFVLAIAGILVAIFLKERDP